MLLKAYSAAATPREIDPFVLRLHSSEQSLIREMVAVETGDFLANAGTVRATVERGDLASGLNLSRPADVFLSAGGMKFKPAWVYKWQIPSKRASPVVMSKQWRRFTENVDRLAA